MSTVFWSSVGAAAGGFVGVIGFFIVRLFIEKRFASPKLIREYLCGNERNQGQATEDEGEIMHHHGKRITNKDELKKLGVSHSVWEWTRDPVGKGAGASTIYGPYSTDFSVPGTYSATFRVKAIGLSHPDDIMADTILFHFDVNKTTPEYVPTNQGIAHFKAQYRTAIKYVKASELAQRGWVEFDLRFHSDAQGIWEYRVIANDGLDSKPDNIGRFGKDVRVFFDTVKISKINEIRVPNS